MDTTGEQSNGSERVGVLLVHGLNGSLRDMEELKDFLASHDIVAVNVLLPGHGTNVRDMLPLGWSEWSDAVTMCAPVYMYPWMLPAVRLVKHFTPVLPTLREDVHSPEARRRYKRDVYRWTPMAPVESMLQYLPSLRTELPTVTAPALIMTAIHDHVVPARDGQAIYRLIGSKEKYLVKFRHSYHVLMKDHDQ